MNWLNLLLDFLVFDSRHRRARLAVAFGVYALVLLLGAVPGARQEVGAFASGGVLHSLTYGFITVLLLGSFPRVSPRAALASLAMVAVLGGLDEFIQGFFPYRSPALADWGVDVASALGCLAVLMAALPFRARAKAGLPQEPRNTGTGGGRAW